MIYCRYEKAAEVVVDPPSAFALEEDFEDATVIASPGTDGDWWLTWATNGSAASIGDPDTPSTKVLTLEPKDVSSHLYVQSPHFVELDSCRISFEIYTKGGGISYLIGFFAAYSAAGALQMKMDTHSNHGIRAYQGASNIEDASDIIGNSKTFVWVEYTKGTGSNGLLKVFYSATDSKPASPQINMTNGQSTAGISYIEFSTRLRGLTHMMFDNVKVEEL